MNVSKQSLIQASKDYCIPLDRVYDIAKNAKSFHEFYRLMEAEITNTKKE